jgi:putative spermidine/putrescine transport system substrate-binding protein
MLLSRRSILASGSAALAAGSLGFATGSRAARPSLATTYPGSFDEAFKSVVGPAFTKASGGAT